MADQNGDLYAHTPGQNGTWHRLSEHLRETAEQARRFADVFSGGDLAYWAGLWHDLGKCNPGFQTYLVAEYEGRRSAKQPHAIWGAALAYDVWWRRLNDPEIWKDLALPVAGHHTGLADGGTLAQDIEQFLAEHPEALQLLRAQLQHLPSPLPWRTTGRDGTRRELFLRMVFSALLDADRLDTEKHVNGDQWAHRGRWPALGELCERLDAKMAGLNAIALETPTEVNIVRQEVYEACCQAAAGSPGVYRLTVPTGGGKTLSALTFAIRHALAQQPDRELRRVIVAMPYTSIIEQTAEVYRE